MSKGFDFPRIPHPVLSRSQKEVNTAHARQRGPPGERANAALKRWKIARQDPL